MSTAKALSAIQKRKQTVSNKLIPRLARYLGDDSLYGKAKVRAALKKGNYKGPGWKDEARAVKVLTEAGFDMSKFERLKPGKGIPSLAAPARIPLTEAQRALVTGSPENLSDRLHAITVYLMQGKKAIFRNDFEEAAGCLLLALSKARG